VQYHREVTLSHCSMCFPHQSRVVSVHPNNCCSMATNSTRQASPVHFELRQFIIGFQVSRSANLIPAVRLARLYFSAGTSKRFSKCLEATLKGLHISALSSLTFQTVLYRLQVRGRRLLPMARRDFSALGQ